MLAAVTFAVLPVRIKELVYGNVQQGDDLVKVFRFDYEDDTQFYVLVVFYLHTR